MSCPSRMELIFSHTKPTVPVVCMMPEGPTDNLDCLQADIRAAAEARGRDVQGISLVDQATLEELLSQLPQLMAEGTWVVLHHCHIFPNWKDILDSLVQVCVLPLHSLVPRPTQELNRSFRFLI